MKDEITYSVSPLGENFPIPKPEDFQTEYKKIEKPANQAKAEGKEVVVVMGVGFVGMDGSHLVIVELAFTFVEFIQYFIRPGGLRVSC